MGTVQRIDAGFGFLEGPVWRVDAGVLLFSDIPNDKVIQYDPKNATKPFSDFRMPSGMSNGLTIDPQGRLLAAEHGNRRVSRTDGTVMPLVERFDGGRFNSPNDVVVATDGTVFFTDPDYGLQGRPRELPVNGVYAVLPSGTVVRLASNFQQPNGIALSPDEQVLYVDDSQASTWRAYRREADGGVTLAGSFVTTQEGGGGGDGMAVDDLGNLYITSSGGVRVYRPDGGYRGRIPVNQQTTNVCFGGDDRRTLFITTGPTNNGALFQVRLAVPGKP